MYFSLFSVQAAVASAFSSHAPSKHGLACLFLSNIYGLTDHLNRKDIQRRSYFYLLYLYQTTLVLCWWIVGLLCHWDGYENCGPLLAFNLALLSLCLSSYPKWMLILPPLLDATTVLPSVVPLVGLLDSARTRNLPLMQKNLCCTYKFLRCEIWFRGGLGYEDFWSLPHRMFRY